MLQHPLVQLLLATVLGSLLTMAGGYMVYRLQERSDRRKRREEKFMELVGNLHEVERWMSKVREYDVGEATWEDVLPEPTRNALIISTIYFPEFEERISRLDSALRKSGSSG